MNLGLPGQLKEAFFEIKKRKVTPKDIPSLLNPYWVAGFTDAEGCFWIKSFKDSSKNKLSTVLGFQITQHNRDLVLMQRLISFFNCGRLEKTNASYNLVITKLSFINKNIIPFFNTYPILGCKSKDYKDWCKAVELKNNKTHLTTEGLEEILKIKSSINSSRQ